MGIIDAQVNYGKSVFGPDCNLDIYIKNATFQGINKSIIIPTSTHEIETEGGIERACIWEEKNNKISYRKEVVNKDEILIIYNPKNPFYLMNNSTLKEIRNRNKNNTSIKLFFAPKVHPILCTYSSMKMFLAEPETVAIKIHGIASHISPSEIPEWLIKLSKEYDKPFIIHTDFFNVNFQDERIPSYLYNIISKNQPLQWINWAKKNEIRAYLSHGLRLDETSAEEVNKSNNLVVGMGPDLMLQDEPMRLKKQTDDYLADLVRIISPNKLVFSTDYRWNVRKRYEWDNLDWETHKRLQQKRFNLSTDDLESILEGNAKNFFKLI